MSLYPEDQEINMFGEKLKYPNMGEDGKFTNGSFSDPKIKPSFIPAETINLILDNLENVMKEANIETNTENTNQLKDAVKKIINNSQNNLEAKINKEITDRTQADTTLQNNINTEKARITKEITDRTNADTNLQNQINTAKYNIPSNGTEVKMPYTIDGKAVYKRFWGDKVFADQSVIISLKDLGVTNYINIVSVEYQCYHLQRGIAYVKEYNPNNQDFWGGCIVNEDGKSLTAKTYNGNFGGQMVLINVEIEYIKG